MPVDERDFRRALKEYSAALEQLHGDVTTLAQRAGVLAAYMDVASEEEGHTRRVVPMVDAAIAVLNSGLHWVREAFTQD